MGKPRVLVADDHLLVAEAFAGLLRPHFEVIGIASNGRTLIETALKLHPDVITIDLWMPVLNGFDAGERLRQLLPSTKLIAMTASQDGQTAAVALRSWANGFVSKTSAAAELVRAVTDALKGRSWVSANVAAKITEEFVRDPRLARTRKLTPRQRDVLQLLAEGQSMKEVASALDITPRTVAFHKYKVMNDFGLKTNSDVFRLALKECLIERAVS
jgi:DNA-binding NarL/FixJ family response regulator